MELRNKSKLQSNQSKPQSGFNVDRVKASPIRDNCKYCTGFTYMRCICIFQFLVPSSAVCPITFPSRLKVAFNMKLQDQLLLTLVKLGLNLEFIHLAYLFKISPQDAGQLFRQWISNMFYRFGSVPIWPSREIIQKNMPLKFKEDFSNTIVILDGTEHKLEKPSSLKSQSQCYSDYKSATTLKDFVGVDQRESFMFI